MKKRRSDLAYLGILIAVVGGAVQINAEPMAGYSVLDLGTLGGPESVATAINDKGWVTGYSHPPGTAGRRRHAFLWDGTLHDIDTRSIFSDSEGIAINDEGQIVGSISDSTAFLYGGTMTLLSRGDGSSLRTNSINNRGEITGSGKFGDRYDPFIYNIASSEFRSIGRLETWANQPGLRPGDPVACVTCGGGAGTAINDAGQVTGNSIIQGWFVNNFPNGGYEASAWANRGFLYDGTMHGIGTFGGWESEGRAINSSGWITGNARDQAGGDTTPIAFLYDGNLHNLGVLETDHSSYGNGINDRGDVVGHSNGGQGSRAFIYTKEKGLRNLNSEISPDSGWLLTDARDINNKGQIVGTGIKNGATHAFIATPLDCDLIVRESLSRVLMSPGDSAEGLRFQFRPHVGAVTFTLKEAAEICGYDHFNWVQIVHDDAPRLPGAPTVFADPPMHGSAAYQQWVAAIARWYKEQHNQELTPEEAVAEVERLFDTPDDLPYYWDESGPVDAGHLRSNMFPTPEDATLLAFADFPTRPKDREGKTTFLLALAGVSKDAAGIWDPLAVIKWETSTTLLDFDPMIPDGFVGFRNLVPRPVSGDIEVTGFPVLLESLSPMEIELLRANGANIAVPEPVSGLGIVVGIAALWRFRPHRRRVEQPPSRFQ